MGEQVLAVASQNGRVVEAEPRVVFITSGPWAEVNEHALVMACTDPRYQAPRKEFIEGHFGLSRYDPIIYPGGPAAILLGANAYAFAFRGRIRELHERHGFQRVIAFAHADCFSYRRRFPDLDDTARRARQIADLRKFQAEVGKLVPGVDVHTYYAEPAGGHVQFLAID